MNAQIILAGFGGQGILFAGKVLAYCAMIDGRHLTWMPSYGPEMRGGTANCSVCISDEEIGSPIIQSPDILVAMNGPSYEKFIHNVKKGGLVLVDGTIIKDPEIREDVDTAVIDASNLAESNGLHGGANMILLGGLLKKKELFSMDTVEEALKKCVSAKRADLIPNNLKAISIGMESV